MNNQFELDERTLKEMLAELFEQGEKIRDYMHTQQTQQEEKDKAIAELSKQTLTLINSFEAKYKNIQVIAPKPDLSGVNETLANGLMVINKRIESGPHPVTKQILFTLFPEQLRSPEHYKVMVWGFLGALFLILTYLYLMHTAK